MEQSEVKFTIGADPEFFLRNKSGKLISAVGLIGGSKWEPQVISEVGHAILEDNVAVEFNIPPSSDAKSFISHLDYVLAELENRVGHMGLEFAERVASATFDEDQLATPEAQLFGCEPDFNAWTQKVNRRPNAADQSLRSCGGHVHVGTDLDGIRVIRAMDLFLGVPAIELDDDTRRRELYGKAGAYRKKPYGVEYRTLSNFWIWKTELKEWVFNQTQKALDFVSEGRTIKDHHGYLIRRAINKGDLSAAKTLGRAYSGVFA